ncbi:uncharacterized protein LOC143247445 [Tachypleus tridentatus]|uniref:uncharacterized protein LOC143247445 n=1 Tax=Tachypleus tridentatus TaxID=6853 RepID=UPI003FCEF080
MKMSGMNNEVLMSSKIKKKSSSLPTESRLETVDHISTFREHDKEKKIKKNTQQRNVSDYRYSCLPLKSFEGNHFSQHESSLSSDTSCSSLEFHRPEEWQKKLSQQRQSANLSEEQQRLYSFVFGLSDFNNPVQPNKLSGTYIPLKENRHMYLGIQDKNDKRESTISSVSSKSSTDSWTRKERREALKARVEAQREQLGESSSEEEMTQKHSRCYSDIGLHRDNRLKSTRSEKYHKRRSQDEANVKCIGSPDKVVDLHEKHVSENIKKPPVAPYLGLCYNWQESNIYKDLTVKEEEQNCQRIKDNAYETKTSNFEMNKLLDETRSVSSLAHFTSNSNATKERSQLPDNPSSCISPDISFCSASGIKYSRASPRTQQREISHRKFSLPINLLTRVTSTITTGRESLADALITSVSGSTCINSHISASCLSLDSEICSKDDQSVQQAYTTSSVVCGSSLRKEPTLALDAPSSALCDPHFGKTFKPLPNNSCPVTCCPPAVQTMKPIQVISHPIMSYTFVGQTNTPPNISHPLNQASTDGRAPTPPPRSSQSKIVYNETVHQLCSSQTNLINHSLLTHTESQKAIDKHTVNYNSSINQRKFVLNEKYSNSRSKIQQSPKSEGKIGNTCVTDTSSKIKMHEKEISQHTKNSNTFTASKNNMIYSYTDMPPKQTLASLINCSKSCAPVYSYTDQAPLSKTFLNKNFPEKTDILNVHDSQRNVKNSTNFVEMMSGIRTRQRNRMTVSNNKFNVRVPKINDYLARPEEVKINEQEQSQVNCNCEMTETDFCNKMINSFNRDTCCTLKTSGNCALSESKCSFTDSVENNASLFLPDKIHSGSTLSLETAKKQIDEFVQRERKKKVF